MQGKAISVVNKVFIIGFLISASGSEVSWAGEWTEPVGMWAETRAEGMGEARTFLAVMDENLKIQPKVIDRRLETGKPA